MRRPSRRIIPALMLIPLGGLVWGGCYTVLKHPSVEIAQDEGSKDCASCHADADLHHFRDSFMDPYGYYPQGGTRWYGYYGVPWWYDDYWYYPDDGPGPGGRVESGGGHLWSRDNAPPSPLPRVGSVPGVAAPAQPQTDDGKTDESKPSEDEPKKKEKKRRLWGRSG